MRKNVFALYNFSSDFVFVLLTCLLIAFWNFKSLDRYVASTWVINYDHGFVKRGLIGSITKTFFGNVVFSYDFINALSLIALLIFIVLLSWLATCVFRSSLSRMFVAVFITSPGTRRRAIGNN